MTRRPISGDERRAAALAGHAGDAETARDLIASSDPKVRATALGALARAGAITGSDLDSAASDPSPVVRSRAAELSAAGDAGALTRLQALTTDSQPSVVEAACFALGELGSSAATAVQSLVSVATRHGDPLSREAAVAALGAVGAPEGLPTVLAALEDKPAVRRRAVLALAAFEGPEVDAALQRATQDRDWQVRQAAEDLITS
jgi:HEAT repeat protein